MTSYDCRVGRSVVDGVEVLSYRIRLPLWQEQEEISDFYREIGERTQSFCETVLKERAEAEFSRSEDPQKRFRFSQLRYRLEGRVTYENRELGVVSVLLVAELSRRGDSALPQRTMTAHTWDLSARMLLPPRQAVSLLHPGAGVPRGLKRRGDLLIDRGRLYWIDGAERTEMISRPRASENRKEKTKKTDKNAEKTLKTE